MIHLTDCEIESFVDGCLAVEPEQWLSDHTLRCSDCRDRLGKTVFRRLADPIAAYDAPIAKAIAAATAELTASDFASMRRGIFNQADFVSF